jgi:hypothetical protein
MPTLARCQVIEQIRSHLVHLVPLIQESDEVIDATQFLIGTARQAALDHLRSHFDSSRISVRAVARNL